MRYDNPELMNILSAEYVLGTLKGGARRRFEQLILKNTALLDNSRWWEKQLNLFIYAVPEKTPPQRVWKNIQSQLFKKSSRHHFWLDFSKLVSAALFASIATFLILQSPNDTSFDKYKSVAILANSTLGSGWQLSLIETEDGKTVLKAYSLNELVLKPTSSYELWLLPEKNGKPISLGLLPQQGNEELVVASYMLDKLNNSHLAVSVEPVGGSPTGQPTGEVIYQGTLINIKKGLNS